MAKCYWCGSTFERVRETKEHLNPRSKGGVHTAMQQAIVKAGLRCGDVELACETCNYIRGDERGGAWIEYPHWLSMSYRKLPPRQRKALWMRGKKL